MFNNRIVFISKDNFMKLTHKSDVILSPEFYWVLKKKLPVKQTWQAKNLCTSLFDGLLPNGNYQYRAIKKGDEFLLFAYDSGEILKRLEILGIDTKLIASVYFAQNELDSEVVYKVGESVLVVNDGIVTKLPAKFIENETKDINEVAFAKLSGIKFSIDKYNEIIDKKSLNLVLIALMIFISISLVEAFFYKKAYDMKSKESTSLYEKYNLPKTSWQIEAIKKRVLSNHEKQVDFRENIYKILNVKLAKKEYFKSMSIEKEKAKFEIVLTSTKRAEIIKTQISKNFNIKNARVKDKVLKMEVTSE